MDSSLNRQVDTARPLSASQSCPCGKTGMADLDVIPHNFVTKSLRLFLPVQRYKCYKCQKNKLLLTHKH